MITQLDTETLNNVNITAITTVLTDTPDATYPLQCQGLIFFNGLDGTGGNFELTVTVDGNTIEPNPQVITFSTAVNTAVWTSAFPVPANVEVLLRVDSPNAGDNNVTSVVAYLYDVGGEAAGVAPTAVEVRDTILDDATRFSGADIATILADMDATLTVGTGEIRATYNTGATLYVLMFNAAGQVWRNNAPQQFLAYVAGAIGVYDIPLSEIATDTGEYRADWPIHANMVEGIYSVVLFDQAGGGPVAADDARIGDTRVMVWDGGSDEITVPVAIDLITDTIIGADSDTLETLSDQLDVLAAGSGGTMETYTVTDDVTGFGLDGAHVWVTSDIAGANIIWDGFANAAGVVNYWHDLATGTTVYLWRELAGYRFDNPDQEQTS